MTRVEEYIDKFTWSRAVCDDCGWKSIGAHANPADAQRDADSHTCPSSKIPPR